ncbi:type II secretion system F family protein [Nocardioidaceae bacterium]|nr:type II secretion system F family protein [Nocardioidaceae bacterium]
MGVLVGLMLGTGLLVLWHAWSSPAAAREHPVAASPRRLAARLDRAGVTSLGPASFRALTVLLVTGSFVVVLLVSRTLPVALVFAAAAGYLPYAWLAGRAASRTRELAEVWPEAVDHLASGVRAGMSLAEAVASLATRGPEPLRPAFAAFAADHQSSGRFHESLERLKDRLADPVGDRVVETLRLAREVGGGDLGRLLRNLSAFLREDVRTRAELQSRQAWTVNGARLAVAAPWLVLLLLSAQPDVIARYASPGGVAVLAFGAALCVAAYRLMVRIGRLPVERRVLA